MLHTEYPETTWTQAFTDGSAEKAVRNGGAGVFIKYPDGSRDSYSFPTGKTSTNFRAESCALLNAAKTLNQKEQLSGHTVILTDCKSLLESLQTEEENKTMREIKTELKLLSYKLFFVCSGFHHTVE